MSPVRDCYNAFSLVLPSSLSIDDDHLRKWSPPYTWMVASIRADGRQRKKKSSKQSGKIHSESEKMKREFLSDNQWVISCRFSETCSPPKGIKGTREGNIADFSFLLRLSWEKPIIKLFTESFFIASAPRVQPG